MTVRHIMVAGALVALAACSPTPPVAVEIREVEVPTPIACVDAEQIPAEPERVADKLTGNAVVDMTILAASALELRKWGEQQNALLIGCAG